MRTRDYKKLKEGQRVSVTGVFEGEIFSEDTGVIIRDDLKVAYDLKIRFDKWCGVSGHGEGRHDYCFSSTAAANFKITVIPEDTKPPSTPAPIVAKKRPHGAQEYKGNGKHSWEKVVDFTDRLRVPGGWIYRDRSNMTSSFVPVPEAVGYAV